jgi:superfamily II DNA/RNA helicase
MFAAGGTVKLLFATEAYSMGVDVHDIRRIIFIGSPATIECQYTAITIQLEIRLYIHGVELYVDFTITVL